MLIIVVFLNWLNICYRLLFRDIFEKVIFISQNTTQHIVKQLNISNKQLEDFSVD